MNSWMLSSAVFILIVAIEAGVCIAKTPQTRQVSTRAIQDETRIKTRDRITEVWLRHDRVKAAELREDMKQSPADFIPALLELIDLKALREKPLPTNGLQLKSLVHLVRYCGKAGRDAAIPLLIRMSNERDQIREQRRQRSRPASEWGTPYVASDKEKLLGQYYAIVSQFSNAIMAAFAKAHDPAIRDLLAARLPNVPWSEQSQILKYLHTVVPNDPEVREIVRRIRDDPSTELHRVRTNRERVNREWNLEP